MIKKFIRVSILVVGIIGAFIFTKEKEINWSETKLIKSEANCYSIEINSNSENSCIVINSENLCDKGNTEVSLIQTTDWFPCADEEALCMYGGFNYAVWEFKLNNDEIVTIDHSEQIFNNPLDSVLANKSCDTVEIPEGSVACRVKYYKAFKGVYIAVREVGYGITGGEFFKRLAGAFEAVEINNALKYQNLYISYGRVPSSAIRNEEELYDIGNLSVGDCIVYSEGEWKIERNNGELDNIELGELHIGSSVSIVSESNTEFDIKEVDEKINYNDVYGVRWKIEDNEMVCERVEGGKYLHANYQKNGKLALPYSNSFDNIYPWSEIKECYLDDEGNVFNNDAGKEMLNCMIEVPKFYYKREQNDGYEYLYISKEKLEGFQLDPAFIGEKGEIDKVYIGKYLTSMQNNEIGSYSSNVPLIDVSYSDLLDYVEQKGNGWEEIDLITLNMLQKLWLVETGVLNSQSIFSGYTESNFIWSSDDDPKYAVKSEEQTDCIWIKKNEYTQKFDIGDPVIVITYDYEDKYSAYKYFSDNYKNDDIKWQREIESIEDNGDLIKITFSGEVMDIEKDVSIIANLPDYCGVTDNLESNNAESIDILGKKSFKYRGIENLWGSVCVLLGGSLYKDNNLYIEYPNGETITWTKAIIDQKNVAGASRNYEVAVNKMAYDVDNSAIFFPEVIKDGATLTNSYGDWFALSKDEHYTGKSDVQCLTYGMTWDLANYAGLFAYRIQPHYDSNMVEVGSRLIYRN